MASTMNLSPPPQLDALVGAFFGVFDNRAGRHRTAEEFTDLFAPGAVIASHGAGGVTFSSPQAFVAPRLALLASGRLTQFSEWETHGATECLGSLACRRSRYAKQGLLDGEPYAGAGTKFFQFALTPAGWRIVALSWVDDMPAQHAGPT